MHRLLTVSLCIATALPVLPAQQPAHDAAFWRQLVAARTEAPAKDQIAPLVRELSAMLASPDPQLRDDTATTLLSRWIFEQRVVPKDTRCELLREWTGNLTAGIGEQGTDTVLLRSFSALALGFLVALDNEEPFLERVEFEVLLAAALAYLRDEVDVRGFDADRGWLHSVAHTADLLKFLARSRHLATGEQGTILAAITSKLQATGTPLVHGEDERLARAVLSLAARTDFEADVFQRWLATLTVRVAGAPTPAGLAVAGNRRHLLVSLFALLSADPRELESVHAARDAVLARLQGRG